MNDRIRELAEQATEVSEFLSGECCPPTPNLEKFAELIIQECAEICYHHSEAAGGVDTAFGYGYKDCGNDIKQHFGVE
jgi:hypothetical protein